MKNPTLLAALVLVVGLGAFGIVQQGGLDVLQGRFTTSGNELSVEVAAGTPKPDIVVGGQISAPFSEYSITSTSITDNITVDQLTIDVKSTSTSAVTNITIEYVDSTGATVQSASHVGGGKASFSGLDLIVKHSSVASLMIYGDVNHSGTGTWSSGDQISLLLDSSGFEAVNMTTGALYTTLNYSKSAAVYPMTVYNSKPTIELSTSSPSGMRTVSAADEIFIADLDVSADSIADASVKSIKFNITTSSTDIATYSAPVTAYLKQGSTTLASAPVVSSTGGATETSSASVTFLLSTPIVLSATATSPTTLSLQLDSATLISEEHGEDDLLGIDVFLGTAVSKGGIIWNDGAKDVRWFGNLSVTTLTGNTLLY